MKQATISFNKRWASDGAVYNQAIKIDAATFDKLNDAIRSELALKQPRRKEYVYTSGYEFYLKPMKVESNVSFLNHTQTRFINLFLNLKLKDRNTCLLIRK